MCRVFLVARLWYSYIAVTVSCTVKLPLNPPRAAVLGVNGTTPSGFRRFWRGLMNIIACNFEHLHLYCNYYEVTA